MAGTLYRSPAPGEPAFVKEGDKVTKGQTICIIEAMKLMNEIEVRLSCKICVSAQSSLFIAHVDGSREHPLVSKATHVCLPIDLGERVYRDGVNVSRTSKKEHRLRWVMSMRRTRMRGPR